MAESEGLDSYIYAVHGVPLSVHLTDFIDFPLHIAHIPHIVFQQKCATGCATGESVIEQVDRRQG